jgi:copper oxidase (laccase) domain-containing protein
MPEGDGHWTSEPNLTLVIKTADCVPLLLSFESAHGPLAVAGVHCGWRSALGGILGNLFEQLGGLAPAVERVNLLAGPHIGVCCFQVGPEVVALGRTLVGSSDWFVDDASGKFRVDLLAHIQHQVKHIARSPLWARSTFSWDTRSVVCTKCRVDRYFSFRAEGKVGNLFADVTLSESN